jgi:hypothetical protein
MTHFRADTEQRQPGLVVPVVEVVTQAEFVNPKDREILPGETRIINSFTSNPKFDAFAVIPRTPGKVLLVGVVKDQPTTATNLNPSGTTERAATWSLIYPFEFVIPVSDVLVADTATVDYGLNGGDNLPQAWDDGAAEQGYTYRIVVHYPASVPDLTAWTTDATPKTVTFRTQTGPALFTAMLVQGGG